MASDYGLNFGFRRSDETLSVRNGRLKLPATGTFRLGSQVQIDPANPGYMKASASGAEVIGGGSMGLLVQEEIWDRSHYAPQNIDSFYYGVARNDRLAIIWAGPGCKVWFKNTVAQNPRADGRVIAAVQMMDLTGVGVGDLLTWDGGKYVKGTDSVHSLLRVSLTNGTDFAECDVIH